MPDDRFRPDAAVRRVSPIQRTPGAITTEEMIGWLDDPRVAGAVRVPGEVAGKRPDRVIVDDPHSANDAVKSAIKDALGDGAVDGIATSAKAALLNTGAALFEDHGPTASVGRRSFPRSHRGEGRNFVD